ELKEIIKSHLAEKGIDVIDVGTFSNKACDYPDIIRKGCAVVLEECIPGIIFGGSGIGESIVANKVKGIRSARCLTLEDAEMCRRHNNANVISLGGRMIETEIAKQMVDIFLSMDFDGDKPEGERHKRRVDDIE
ncbi:RpiB/LacA/LacB family sugar-phosphate isomerase, partial [Patescibacteria group bacterium]|nr:RpiB/LacA/LacB family sugar-phosphate isomerase [Patescibacteria group bacterium]